MINKTRNDFETWWKLSYLMPCDYKYRVVQEGWNAWQAATAVEQERCAKVCESLHYTQTSTAQNCADTIRKGGDA